MDKKFNAAVGTVSEHLKSNQYSYSITRCYMRCYQLLKAYIVDNKQQYSGHLAEQWIQGIGPGMCNSTLNTYRIALKKLDLAYRNEEIGNTKEQYESHQNYQRLNPWCKNLLDTFLDEISDTCGRSYLQILRISIARFLNYLTEKGGNGPNDITHRFIAGYYRDDEHGSYISKDAYNSRVKKFLHYLSNNGKIQASMHLALDKFVLQRLIFIETLSDMEQEVFLKSSCASSLRAEEFREKTLKMDAVLEQHLYSKSIKKSFRIAWRELFIFLEANAFHYSIDLALVWATYMRQYTIQWKSFRRAMMLFEQYRVSGLIKPQKVFNYEKDRVDALPEWCKDDYQSFHHLKKKEGYAWSTLSMFRSSCLRLLDYLIHSGVSAWSEVTPETLKEFHIQDPHSTAEGKNAYSSKIRTFLEYLGKASRVPVTLFMAVPSEAATRVNIIDTLSDDDVADIYQFSKSVDNTMAMRHAAMILIGLRMGIRASDITKLKFIDISWEQKTISIQQQKTGVFIKLPMPVEVGNALYRYIMHGRPNCSSEYIFIAHRVPYNKLSRRGCSRALQKVLPEKSCGFHVTRKTFASRMLKNGIQIGRIAETLGHSTNQSVMTYLSTDDDNMKLCALSLEQIPVKGGWFE